MKAQYAIHAGMSPRDHGYIHRWGKSSQHKLAVLHDSCANIIPAPTPILATRLTVLYI